MALCYYEAFNARVRDMRETLRHENGDPEHDRVSVSGAERRLRTWLENEPLLLVLRWFDSVESIEVSSAIHKRRWSTKTTQRDQLFLKKLGMKTEDR